MKSFTIVLGGSCWGGNPVILSCAAHQILTNSMLFTITHRFMAGSSEVIGQRKKRRKLGSESGSGNLRNTRRAPASLARDPRVAVRGVRDREADREALKDGDGPSRSRSPNGDTPKRLDRLASLARDPRVAVRGVRDREADREALKDGDGPSRSRSPNGDTPKRLDRLASLARDPRAVRDREADQEVQREDGPSLSQNPSRNGMVMVTTEYKPSSIKT